MPIKKVSDELEKKREPTIHRVYLLKKHMIHSLDKIAFFLDSKFESLSFMEASECYQMYNINWSNFPSRTWKQPLFPPTQPSSEHFKQNDLDFSIFEDKLESNPRKKDEISRFREATTE